MARDKRSSIPGRRRNQLAENWASHRRSMLESPAWKVLSRGARQFLDRLEIEHMAHGGKENGKLPLTYQDLIDYGMSRNQIAPAEREVVALGFAECTTRGRGGNAEHRAPNLWRITYPQNIGPLLPTDEWARIKTSEEAEAVARKARAEKDPKKVAEGKRRAQRKNKSRYQKHILSPVSGTHTEGASVSVPVTNTTEPVRKLIPLSISRGYCEARSPSAVASNAPRERLIEALMQSQSCSRDEATAIVWALPDVEAQ